MLRVNQVVKARRVITEDAYRNQNKSQTGQRTPRNKTF